MAVVALRMSKTSVSGAPPEAPKRFRNRQCAHRIYSRPVLATVPSPYIVPGGRGTPGTPLGDARGVPECRNMVFVRFREI